MSWEIVVRRAAQAEMDRAAVWYEERSDGLGLRFLEEVEQALRTIADDPYRFAIVRNDVREAFVRVFPYRIYFRLRADRVVVIAVFHTARDPTIWQSRR